MADRPSIPKLAGTLPDAEVAALADASIEQVLAYRRAHRIPPFVRSPPGRTPADTARAAGETDEFMNEEDLPDEPEAPPEPARSPAPFDLDEDEDADEDVAPDDEDDEDDEDEDEDDADDADDANTDDADDADTDDAADDTATAGSAAASPRRRRGRLPTAEGRLASYVDQLGQISDGEIAERSGLSLGTVGAYRRKLGIAAYTGFLWQKGHEPVGGGRKKKSDGAENGRAKQAAQPQTPPRPRGRPRKVVAPPEPAPAAGLPTPARSVADTVRSAPRSVPMPQPTAADTSFLPSLAFTAVVRQGDRERSFIVLGTDIVAAAERARAALVIRREGAWRIESLSLLGEALEDDVSR